ncbi:MAG TPA: M13 family metallopeptidase [Terriglobales bacterium]|nr:M13 family metallopeptidase [Terriglobales bacterium]
MTNASKLFRSALVLCVLIMPAVWLQAQSSDSAGSTGASALPYTPSLDLDSMDRAADPCVDFYQYACGGWIKRNRIPADRTAWDVYSKLHEDNLALLRNILQQAAAAKERDAVTQKVGDFYAACMDEETANKRGLSALRPELDSIASVRSKKDLATLAANLQLMIAGSSIMFGAGSQQDPDNTEQEIAVVDQGGIGLPDRDYYTKTDAKSKEIREHYLQHVQKIFEMTGDSPAVASKNAAMVMRLETALAEASWTAVDRRDPYKQKHKMTLPELNKLAPNFDWSAFFQTANAPKFEIVNVSAPAYFNELNVLLAKEPLQNWKNYLRFQLVNSYSPFLSAPFVQEGFDFYRKYLRGAEQMQPRWKRCVQYTDNNLGEALGQAYVRQVFSPELKQSTLQMVANIEQAMEQRIDQLDWMSPQTKQQALVKLHAIRNKIGYPDKWRDYSPVAISANDFAGDVRNAIVFESHREINKIGQPVDHNEWFMTPPTVDAYYDPQMNDINFPAGVLRPPLDDPKMDAAPNYGDTGSTIGHELTHAFDDEGRQFDAKGNLRDWWTKEDAEKFTQHAQCVVDQYAQYIAVDDIHINSKLTEGEDVADLGGTILGYIAWKMATKDQNLQPLGGLTPDQRYFVGFAQWACGSARPEQLRDWAISDPHSPLKYRVNGVIVNIPEFGEAFSCKAGQPMVKAKDKVCRVW